MARTIVKCGNPDCLFYENLNEPCPRCGLNVEVKEEAQRMTATAARIGLTSQAEDTTVSKDGAKSSPAPAYHLIPPHALARLARRYSDGAKRYGENNWQKGLNDPAYVIERLDHAVGHALALIEEIRAGVPSNEDHAAALMWAGAFACEATKAIHPELHEK